MLTEVKHVESVVRTNKLYCSKCSNDIKKGDLVVFELTDEDEFIGVYCIKCKHQYMQSVIENSEHPYSSEALGQD